MTWYGSCRQPDFTEHTDRVLPALAAAARRAA